VSSTGAGTPLARAEEVELAHKLGRAPLLSRPADAVRTSFWRGRRELGHPEAACPKSWRHSFATLLQDANVDPLIRQQTLGHQPTSGTRLGMTGKYTHTRPKTQRRQIEQALRRCPASLRHAAEGFGGAKGPACEQRERP
jgi:integrase